MSLSSKNTSSSSIQIAGSAPCVSVMIPVYRPDHYLRQTLTSVLQQGSSCPSLQIALVDDASPRDDLVALLSGLPSTERIEIYRNENNLGLAGNWNKAVSLARGEFVHILHQDDVVLPGFYERLVNGLQRTPHAGMAFCRHAFIDAQNTVDRISHRERWRAGLLRNWLARISMRTRIQCPAAIVRRAVFETLGGFNAELKYALDWEMWVRIACRYPVWYEPEMLAYYRRHADNESARLAQEGKQDSDTLATIATFSGALPEPQRRALTDRAYRYFVARNLKKANKLAQTGATAEALETLQSATAGLAKLRPNISTQLMRRRLLKIATSLNSARPIARNINRNE